jgi:hypothetical protein
MDESDRNLLNQTINTMRLLQSELSSFRGQMKEFKKSVTEKIKNLEDEQRICQKKPETCANARRLEEHLRNHGGVFSKVFIVLGFVIAFSSLLLSMVLAIGGIR